MSNTQIVLDPNTGEIRAKSDWNMLGYYDDEEEFDDPLAAEFEEEDGK